MIHKHIRLSKSVIGDLEKEAVLDALEDGYLGMGKFVEHFEKSLSELMSRPVVCVANGTSALQLALQACGINKGDEVLVQSLTYVASFQAITATGAKPIACDIDPKSLTIDVNDAKSKITNKTKAIMPVHFSGSIDNYEEIYELANEANIRVIEDAAHAFGTKYKNKIVGSFGDIVCFSFDGIKNITSGEGGCIVTSDLNILEKVKDSRLLGISKETESRFASKRKWDFNVDNQGWRYHMSNIMAAIGISQLKRLEEFSNKRKILAKEYDHLFQNNKNITTFNRNYEDVMPHIYCVLLQTNIKREDLRKYLLEKGIETGIHYKPNHLLNYFRDSTNVFLTQTDIIYPKLLTLPLHPEIELNEVKYIVDSLNEYFNECTN